ncbi:Clp protease N-terminal domain-containing protein [Nonomuraea sp. NPDC050790]|uniref:Clp protease N-terminal domain-containing protein n=1 Tax=Nonomuraea sp. NPDC050790 TaxID=3364371 RepID=UPI0037953E79
MWNRLSPEGAEVVRLAYVEARESGTAPWTSSYIGDEHVLLAILRHGDGPAARLLAEHGLELADARERLRDIGPSLRPHVDGGQALRAFGVDPDALREQLRSAFGPAAVEAAERRVRRRPWWRGGHSRHPSPRTFLLAKRAFDLAERLAIRQGATGIGPEHLLFGILGDALDPVGIQLSRRSRRQISRYGWRPGRPNPLRLLLEMHELDPRRLSAELCAGQGWIG